MNLLLDTHILIWWFIDSPDLPNKYLKLLTESEQGKHSLSVSIISFWEIAKLVSLQKLQLTYSLDDWFIELERDPLITIVPLDGRIILESTRLGPDFHKDPSDQLIVATARTLGLKLMTVDKRIVASKKVIVV